MKKSIRISTAFAICVGASAIAQDARDFPQWPPTLSAKQLEELSTSPTPAMFDFAALLERVQADGPRSSEGEAIAAAVAVYDRSVSSAEVISRSMMVSPDGQLMLLHDVHEGFEVERGLSSTIRYGNINDTSDGSERLPAGQFVRHGSGWTDTYNFDRQSGLKREVQAYEYRSVPSPEVVIGRYLELPRERSLGELLTGAAFLHVVERKPESGRVVLEAVFYLTSQADGGLLPLRVTVDPSLGFAPTSIVTFGGTDGVPNSVIENLEFRFVDSASVWFPVVSERSVLSKNLGTPEEISKLTRARRAAGVPAKTPLNVESAARYQQAMIAEFQGEPVPIIGLGGWGPTRWEVIELISVNQPLSDELRQVNWPVHASRLDTLRDMPQERAEHGWIDVPREGDQPSNTRNEAG